MGPQESTSFAMVRAEACDAFVIGAQRTNKLDGSRDEESIRRIALLKMMKLVNTAGCTVT